jgi:hypothetical protein
MQEVVILHGLTSKPPEKAEETAYRKNEGTYKSGCQTLRTIPQVSLEFLQSRTSFPRAASRGFHMYKEMSGKETHMTKAVSVGIREQGA